MNTEIITSLTNIVIIITAGIFTKYIIPFLKAKIDTEKMTRAYSWIKNTVLAAEQIFSDKGLGAEKKAYVIDRTFDFCTKNNIRLTKSEIETLLESFVNQINKNKNAV